MSLKRVLAPVLLFGAMFSITGCASYRDLPAGTHQRIAAKPDTSVVREVVDLSPSANPPAGFFHAADYIVGPNDVLYVSVNGRAEFGAVIASGVTTTTNNLKGYRVDGRGCVYLPLAGKIQVSGLPLAEARERIASAMRRYFNDPSVVVEISEYRVRQVFIFGAVRKPGPFPMPASGISLPQLMSVADLNESGGNFHKVRIIRSNTPTQGELLIVDFDRMLTGQAIPLQLQEGDIVYVPKSSIGSWNEVISEILPSLQAVSATLQPFVNIKYLRQ